MRFYADSNAVHFRCDHGFFSAVEAGVKTAEVRLLSRAEWDEVQAYQPKTMHLTSLHTNQTITRRIGYMAEVGELVGNHLILFCFACADEGSGA